MRAMLKSIAKVGNSYGLIFDAALRELSGLQPGDPVNVTVHEGGSIVITPLSAAVPAAEARTVARALIRRNSRLFKRLA
jgi:antitoxin component of MazEF toxin-antitoxin module